MLLILNIIDNFIFVFVTSIISNYIKIDLLIAK